MEVNLETISQYFIILFPSYISRVWWSVWHIVGVCWIFVK